MQATAPYNFVPASETVLFPSWADRVSHDVPFRDGLCGHLDLEITTHTPLFIRGHDREGPFFQTPDGNPALPGTSLRGMLRTVVQIASFGKLGPVNDRRLSMRDVNDLDYRTKLASVSAGWLKADPNRDYDGPGEDGSPRWTIEPCHFAKIEYGLLQRLFPKFDPGKRRSASEKYRDPGLKGKSLEQALDIAVQADAAARAKLQPMALGDYGKVTGINPAGTHGSIVLTGQPQAYSPGDSGRKHHDFFFYGKAGKEIVIPFAKRRDFSFIHSTGGEQHRLDSSPNPDWDFWLKEMRSGAPVPVFFLLDTRGALRAFGLAMMFRLACEKTTGDVVLAAQRNALDPRPDLAELLFGRVLRTGGTAQALRGRVSLEAAVPIAVTDTLPAVSGPGSLRVLGAPRASYYPNYLLQREPQGPHPAYETYDSAKPKARGWKRYPSRMKEVDLPPAPTPSVAVPPFAPLAPGVRFATRLHFHNLRPVELGAIFWALDFGGRAECRHALGLAKPYGYGAVTIAVKGHELVPNDPKTETPKPDGIREEFRKAMNGAVSKWEQSDQIRQLLAMARPASPQQEAVLKPMVLEQFPLPKKKGGKPLPAYPMGATAPATPSLSAFDQRLAVIEKLGAQLMGQADSHLKWFTTLTDPVQRKRAAAAIVHAATDKTVKKKVKEGSELWAAVWAAHSTPGP